jgi:hypothetical protein
MTFIVRVSCSYLLIKQILSCINQSLFNITCHHSQHYLFDFTFKESTEFKNSLTTFTFSSRASQGVI